MYSYLGNKTTTTDSDCFNKYFLQLFVLRVLGTKILEKKYMTLSNRWLWIYPNIYIYIYDPPLEKQGLMDVRQVFPRFACAVHTGLSGKPLFAFKESFI